MLTGRARGMFTMPAHGPALRAIPSASCSTFIDMGLEWTEIHQVGSAGGATDAPD